jgi:predicted DNA-binding transcriptional regulator AlpA
MEIFRSLDEVVSAAGSDWLYFGIDDPNNPYIEISSRTGAVGAVVKDGHAAPEWLAGELDGHEMPHVQRIRADAMNRQFGDNADRMLTIPQAAAHLGVSRQRVHQLISSAGLCTVEVRVPKRTSFYVVDIDDLDGLERKAGRPRKGETNGEA